jgi:hypothetical protein
MGTQEVGDPAKDERVVNDVHELESILQSAHLGKARLKVVVEEGGLHNEATWGARFAEALEFLFGA